MALDEQPEDSGVTILPVTVTPTNPNPERQGFNIHIPDMMRQSIEASSGGRETVLYDKDGIPSVMTVLYRSEVETACNTVIGANTVGDTGAGALFESHPAFVVNNIQLDRIFIAKHLTSWIDTTQTTTAGATIKIPVSRAGAQPAYNLSFSDMINGTGTLASIASKNTADNTNPNYANHWHPLTWAELGALRIWSVFRRFIPGGNTNDGSSLLDVNQLGTRFDSTLPYTFTGTGPLEWYNGVPNYGQADLVGNVQEWVTGVMWATWELFGGPSDADNALVVPVFINNNDAATVDAATLTTPDVTLQPWQTLNFDTGLPIARSQLSDAIKVPAMAIVGGQPTWYNKLYSQADQERPSTEYVGDQRTHNLSVFTTFDRTQKFMEMAGLLPTPDFNISPLFSPDPIPAEFAGSITFPSFNITDSEAFYCLNGGNSYPEVPSAEHSPQGEHAPGGFLSMIMNDGGINGPNGAPYATGSRMAVVEIPAPAAIPPAPSF